MTLIDSRPQILASFAELAAETGARIDLGDVEARLGLKLEDELAHWFDTDALPAAAATYRRHYLAIAPAATRALPGAREALAAVRARGARTAIVTAKHGDAAELSLQVTGLESDELYCLVHGPEKAEVLRRIVAAVYVGDTPDDMAAACAAGALAVGVATGTSSARDLRAAGAAEVLDTLEHFPGLYASLPGA